MEEASLSCAIPSHLSCFDDGTKSLGKSCGKKPIAKWCDNSACCDTNTNVCVAIPTCDDTP